MPGRSRQLPRAADEPASQGFQDPENVSRGSDVQESQNASGLLRKKGSPQTYRDKGVECGLNFAETLKNGELGECLKMSPKFAECADFCPLEDSLETRISTAFPRIRNYQIRYFRISDLISDISKPISGNIG